MPDVPSRALESARLLAELSRVSERLNSASDDLNASLGKIQDRVVAMGLGVEVWIGIAGTRIWNEENQPIEDWTEYQLGFARHGDGWALMTRKTWFVEAIDDAEEFWDFSEEKPLLRSPRDLRLESVKVLPDLLAKLIAEADEKLALVDAARALAGVEEPKPDVPVLFDLSAQTVRCIVSDRYLVIGRPDVLAMGEVVGLDVMTDMASGLSRKLCQLIVPKDALLRALSQPPRPQSDSDDTRVN